MKILILSATFAEISPFLSLTPEGELKEGTLIKAANTSAGKHVYVLISGVGMINTAYYLAKAIADIKPDLCINTGIAGAFNQNILMGEVVKVKNECFADLGVEDGDDFIGVEEMGFGKQAVPANELNLFSSALVQTLRAVNAISVNTVHGNEKTIARCAKKYPADIESMEGAAFMMVCQKENVRHLQIRSISNYVERRNRENWNIPLAIKNLNDCLKKLVEEI